MRFIIPSKCPDVVEIESLKSSLLKYTERDQVPDPCVDVLSSTEVGARNSSRLFLREKLSELFKIIDKIPDLSDVAAIYSSLDHVILASMLSGQFSPNETMIGLRKETKEAEIRSHRKDNVAAEQRRERMLPLVEEVSKTLPELVGFKRQATKIYHTLKDRHEFKILIEEADRQLHAIARARAKGSRETTLKGLSPRQIKEDIEALLIALDERAELERRAGL